MIFGLLTRSSFHEFEETPCPKNEKKTYILEIVVGKRRKNDAKFTIQEKALGSFLRKMKRTDCMQ